MNRKPPNRRVCFEGRDCDVVIARLYVGDYYDIWLQDVATQKFTDVCTVTNRNLPVDGRERLVLEPYVGILTEAGYITPTGETIETEKYGTLVRSLVPERQRVRTPMLEDAIPHQRDAGDDIEL